MNDKLLPCPFCGKEYLPAEIYIPNYFFGRPTDIEKDVYGKVLDYMGTSMDKTEKFTCDCGKIFSVTAKIFFNTSKVSKEFDEEYVSKRESKLIMPEE